MAARFALPALCLLLLTCAPAAGAAERPTSLPPVGSDASLRFMSQAVSIHRWARDPAAAPTADLREAFRAVKRARTAAAKGASPDGIQAVLSNVPFTGDSHGLPQNEESVTVCRDDGTKVLGGTNDYRGLLFPGFTGWHYSANGGAGLAREGGLPPLAGGVPSQGDAVAASQPGCALYMASLNFNDTTSQIGLYRTAHEALTAPACAPNANGANRADPDCWLARRAVMSTTSNDVFYDKPWTDAGPSGAAGNVVWTAATRFSSTADAGSSRIKAVRCNRTIDACTGEIQISDPGDSDFANGSRFTHFSHVEIGDSGRTYISWVVVTINPNTGAQTFTLKVRSAPPGSTVFGPSKVVASLPNAIGFDSFLAADSFRVATVPQMTSKLISPTVERVFVSYEACQQRKEALCYAPQARLSRFDVNPATGAAGAVSTSVVSVPGSSSNYFTSVNADPFQAKLAMAYYTNRVDPAFDHRQAVELLTLNTSGVVTQRQLVSSVNEPDADPFLGGAFIGDYIEVAPRNGVALTHYNANLLKKVFMPTVPPAGLPVNQQDNFLSRASY